MCDQQSLRSACTYAQSYQILCLLLEYSMSVKLLIEHHLEFLSLVYTSQNATMLGIMSQPAFAQSRQGLRYSQTQSTSEEVDEGSKVLAHWIAVHACGFDHVYVTNIYVIS